MYEVPKKEVHLVLFRDNNARMYEGTVWNAYTFEDEEDMRAMVADLQDPNSVWKSEAVTIITQKILIPVTELEDASR